MANSAKVMDSIKNFLLKMKALDENIPEELAQDALSMTEEVKDALCEDEEVEDEEIEEKEVVKDEEEKKDEAEDEAEVEKKMEDAFVKVLHKYGLIKDSAMSALDELEKETEDADEEDVTVDPEKINDSAKALIREVKPVIAGIKDSATRKMLADSFAKAVKMNHTNSQYGDVMQILGSNAKDKAKDSKPASVDTEDFGMQIAKKYNPHYMKEGN